MKKEKKKKNGFTLIELMVVITIIGIMAIGIFKTITDSFEREAVQGLKTIIAGGLDDISQQAKNGETDPDYAKFRNSSNSTFRNIYNQNISKQGKAEFLSRYSPINQTAFYYGLYFSIGKTFLKTVQYEQEGCKERREALTDKWTTGTNFKEIDLFNKEVNLDLSPIMALSDNTSQEKVKTEKMSLKEAEMLDSGHCYISSENKYFGTQRPIWLTGIDYHDGVGMRETNPNDGVVILVDANKPYDYKIFKNTTGVNSIRNFYSYENIDDLSFQQRKYLLKNYGTDRIQNTGELKVVDLQFSNTGRFNPNKCGADDFVDFSTRVNSGRKLFDNAKKGIVCLRITKKSLDEISRAN